MHAQAVAIRGAGPGGSAAGGSAAKTCSAAMAAVALDWRHDSLSNKNCEGSATSDEDHPRLVPRRGAGPELRSGGREIDEYLMRLLHAGSASASEAAMYQNEVRLFHRVCIPLLLYLGPGDVPGSSADSGHAS